MVLSIRKQILLCCVALTAPLLMGMHRDAKSSIKRAAERAALVDSRGNSQSPVQNAAEGKDVPKQFEIERNGESMVIFDREFAEYEEQGWICKRVRTLKK